jgi:hypothetical protein
MCSHRLECEVVTKLHPSQCNSSAPKFSRDDMTPRRTEKLGSSTLAIFLISREQLSKKQTVGHRLAGRQLGILPFPV